MKKVLAMVLALMMVLSVGVVAFANGGFVSSPSNELAPEFVSATNASGESVEVIITAYQYRYNLNDNQRAYYENAYKSIKDNGNLTKLCDGLAAAAGDVPANSLGVSDLFHASVNYEVKVANAPISVKLDVDDTVVNYFVALMQYVDGKWEVVKEAEIVSDNLVFEADELGVFAIVVDTQPDDAVELPIIESIIRLLKSVLGLFR